MSFQRLLLVLCAVPSLAPIASGQEFYLREDDRVLFHGETKPADRLYESLIETYVTTRFPRWNVLLIHSVWPGSPPPAALSGGPTVMVVPLEAGNGNAEVASALRALIQRMMVSFPRARITALQQMPPPREGNTTLVDAIGAVQAAAEKAKARDEALAATILKNGVPAGEAGHLLLAQSLLQAWHAPALVTAVEIDARRGAVNQAENTTVHELENGRVIAWSQDDQAMPMAVDFTDPAIALAISCSDFMRLLNQQTLRIRGMAAEWYRLTIDGESMGYFARNKLEEGINLAGLATPMWKEAMAVHALSRKHAELQADGARLFQAPEEERQSMEWKAALEAWTAAESELVSEQRSRARPRTHDYELVPVER